MDAQNSIYPRKAYNVGEAGGVTVPNPASPKIIPVRHNMPGSIILVHGVNDVGTAYAAVERGLCEGLSERLKGDLRAADYRLPEADDKKKLSDDPDAIFYKRKLTDNTLSPVIPFYWGFREDPERMRNNTGEVRGQKVDRHGNRLDKDMSKGGGPFANATSTLPDMWNRGKWGVFRMLDRAQEDATHPVLNCPGRMYMILAAQRLAALICMIRDYDKDETVSIVAHSQGCLISLLAQAFLLDPKMKAQQANARPADTLILNNPPYSLVDKVPMLVSLVDGYTDSDDVMKERYRFIDGMQTLNSRMSTLRNIVQGVWNRRHASPPLAELSDVGKYCGAVGAGWKAAEDRDNRGKVYLYFGPEDMTVALAGVQGIGWQGIPRFQRGTQTNRTVGRGGMHTNSHDILRRPLEELGLGFRQRVFTRKRRPDPVSGDPVQIGAKGGPHEFLLRVRGEDDQAHTAVSDTSLSKNHVRSHLSSAADFGSEASAEERQSQGLRYINGEVLPNPAVASLLESAQTDRQGRAGGQEEVDPIDAAIAITSEYGVNTMWFCMPYQIGQVEFGRAATMNSPRPALFEGLVGLDPQLIANVQASLNKDKKPLDCVEVLHAYICLDNGFTHLPIKPGRVLVHRAESPNEARLRWQNINVPRSFHGAIFSGKENHRNVTAYDVAIGSGKATSDPFFYKYLCAVADWRLQKFPEEIRSGIAQWLTFSSDNALYLSVEPEWRRHLIKGNCDYYSTGKLPQGLPLLPEDIPVDVLFELKG